MDRLASAASFHHYSLPRRALGRGPRGGDAGRRPALASPSPAFNLAKKKKKKESRTALLSSDKSEKLIKIDVVQERVTRKDFIDFLKWKSFKA